MRITKRTLTPLRQSEATRRTRPDKAWAVYYPTAGPNGGPSVRRRRFFSNRTEAEAFCSVKRAEIASLGVRAGNLSEELKREALMCHEMLAGSGRTLTEAVASFLRGLREQESSITVSAATDRLLEKAKVDGMSVRHRSSMASTLSRFGKTFGTEKVAGIKLHHVQGWLDGYRVKDGRPLSPVSFNTYRAYLALFFSFCLKRGWATSNPVAGIDARKVLTKVPRLMSASDLRRVLAKCPPELKPALALQAFCGCRVSEVARLRWSDVLIGQGAEGFVQIGAQAAKTSRRRLTPITPLLANYLSKVRGEGFVYAPGGGRVNSMQFALANLRDSLSGAVAWSRNALRASAVSYRLALTKDAAATALEFGHSQSVLMRDYRELTTPTEAREWFSVEI
jgi:integrase